RDARLELVERLLVVLVARRLDAGEPCRAVLRLVAGDLHLPRQREHVGGEPPLRQHGGIGLLGGGECGALVEHAGQRGETDLEDRQGSLRRRIWHGVYSDDRWCARRGAAALIDRYRAIVDIANALPACEEMMAELDKQSLRGFLAQVERDLPDEILRIREPVRTHLDITSLVYELEHQGRSPLVVFEKVEGHDMPVVTNVAGNRRLLALALG